jgi:RNA polymerase sigma-54 factor
MLLQLPSTDPDFEDIRAMLTVHIEALACNKFPEVARALKRPLQEVQDLLARIKTLDPFPGAGFSSPIDSESVFPDVTVRLVGGEIEIEIDDMVLPDLGIQPDYELMASDKHVDSKTRSYLSNKLKLARELIGAVEQRKRTLGRVAFAMMTYQRGFLMQGALSVRPLCMSQIAEQVGLHPSTVSRAIAGKFAQTDHGIFRLRDFFDGDRRNSISRVAGTGRMAVKDHVRDLVNSEDSRCPLSDDDLVQRLVERDIRVARRTVAKYRKELGLPSSWRRRTFESDD